MQALIIVATLILVLLSLATPLYSIVMLIRVMAVRSTYSAWPPLLMLLVWLAQWPALFVLALKLPGGGSIGGDGHESAMFDVLMLVIFMAYNAGPLYWVYRHRAGFALGS